MRLAGWQWNIAEYLKKFVVQFTWGGLEYRYAPDKTALRKSGIGNVEKIIEIPNN
jgi:hypothetical protein